MLPDNAYALAEEFRRRGLPSIARLIETMESNPLDVEVGLCICTIAEFEAAVEFNDPYPYFIEVLRILDTPTSGNETAAHALDEACCEVMNSRINPGLMTRH